MDEPRPELTADADEQQEGPDFDELVPPEEVVSGERTRDDFFDAVLGLTSPATASEVAELAGHGVDAAREYLEWFERMGIVTQVADSPALYERNQEYLNWRRVQRLRDQYTDDELLEFLKDAAARDEAFEAEFAVESPDAVAIAEQAAETNRSIEGVWRDVSEWQTIRRRISLLEWALQADSDGTAGQRTVA